MSEEAGNRVGENLRQHRHRVASGSSLASSSSMFFHSWGDIGRVIAATSIVFTFIIAIMRVVGPQALAKMSPFDMVFTVTLGSMMGAVALTKSITISEAATAIVTLLALQEAVRWIQARSLKAHHTVRQTPRVLLWDGQLLEDRLEGNNISADEVRSAVRKAGLMSLKDAQLVVLENDGEWSVVKKEHASDDVSAIYGLPIPGIPDNSPKDQGHLSRPASNYKIP